MNDNSQSENTIYEIGFHLVPSIDENEAVELSNTIKTLIQENKGNFISEEAPKLRSLAYDISKNINSKNQVYNRAYFGWIKFEAPSSSIEEIKNGVESNLSVLRSIIVKTVRENTMYTQKVVKRDRSDREESEVDPLMTPEEVKPASEEEIDKSIEELVIS